MGEWWVVQSQRQQHTPPFPPWKHVVIGVCAWETHASQGRETFEGCQLRRAQGRWGSVAQRCPCTLHALHATHYTTHYPHTACAHPQQPAASDSSCAPSPCTHYALCAPRHRSPPRPCEGRTRHRTGGCPPRRRAACPSPRGGSQTGSLRVKREPKIGAAQWGMIRGEAESERVCCEEVEGRPL